MRETNADLEKQIQEKLDELDKAVENSRKFYAKNFIPGDFKPMDLFEMALAFDTVSLLETEYEILLAKCYKHQGWEWALEKFQQTAKNLKKNIEHWKKRELPPWND